MQNSIWNAVAGSIFEMRRLEITANNLANADTTGFKSDGVTFSSYLAQVQRPEFGRARDRLTDIQQVIHQYTNYDQGTFKATENPFDMAIEGRGFFTVQTPGGVQYTRAGNFRPDEQGQLVTADGYVVVGEGGPIQLQDGQAVDLHVDEWGTVYQSGDEIGRLTITDIANPETLVRTGAGRFKSSDGTRTAPLEEPLVRQGVLEGSNVNVVREVTDIVQTGRAFEAYQRVLALENSINEKANNQIPGQS